MSYKKRQIGLVLAAVLLLTAARPMAAGQWQARWISRAYCSGDSNTWIAFQKKVSLDAVPAQLPAKIAADSKYWLWINGEMAVREGGLKRGPAPGDGYYDTLDIAPYLKPGQNVISVLVWYFGRSGFSHMGSGVPALLFEAVGDGVSILSDDSWDACQHFAYGEASGKKPNYRLSESNVRYSATLFKKDWYKGSAKKMGSAYELAIEPGQPPFGRLLPRPVPLWKDYGLRDYEEVRRSGDTLICRLPYNAQFSPYMELQSRAGRIVKLATDHDVVTGAKCLHGEYLTANGSQSYEHLPWLNGQYMYYIAPKDVTITKVQYRETGYDCAFSGYFRCDDPLLNDYWQKAQRTLYICMRDTWMDCPDRERAQWIGDEVHEMAEAVYALSPSSAALARKGFLEFARWQAPDGGLYAPVPCSNWFRELAQQSLAAAGWFGFRDFWFYTGDDAFAAEVFPALHRYLHGAWTLDADGLPVERTKGWNWADAGRDIDKTALLHPWYYLALKGERDLALLLGDAACAAEDEALMARIKESYNRLYWNGSCYKTPAYDGPADDRVQAMAAVSGLADADKYPALLKVLDERREAETYIMRWVLEAYYVMGRPDMALERLRSYIPEVTDSCSTLWEHRGRQNSCNHAWSGHGIIQCGSRIAGIEPVKPGFREFSVSPRMAGLKHVEAGLETAFGMIEVVLDRKGRRINAVISVPEGTTALVKDTRGRQERLPAGKHKLVINNQ